MTPKHITAPSRTLSATLLVSTFAALLFFCGTAVAQQCDFYPIALSAQEVSNTAPGTVLNDILNGTQPGNFGWLSWGGSPSEQTLVTSLTAPGNSSMYVNPDTPSDHQISVGDWIAAKPGVSNSKKVRGALDALKGFDITVPVWDQTRGSGDHVAYRVVNFARVRLTSYQLPGQNRITVRFLGMTTCGQINVAPVVQAGFDITSTVHELPVTIALNGSVTDDGLPVGGTLISTWSLLSGPAPISFADSNSPITTATFDVAGTYVLQLSANDGELTSSNSLIVTIDRENQAPQASAQTVIIDEDVSTNLTLQGNDPDNDALTFQVITLPQFGILAGTPPNVVYTPKPDYNGPDSFTFTVNDGQLDSAPATVNITIQPVNDAPVADSIEVTNDENSPFPIVLSGSDVEGSNLTFVLVTAPAHGALDVQPGALSSAQLTYTPQTNFSGNDSFTFKVNDGELDSETATVSITVLQVNLPPDVDAGPDQLISEPTQSVNLQGVVTDDNFFGYDSVTVEWRKVSGPGDVAFSNATSRITSASFSQPGVYVLRLTANDSVLESSDDVQIIFNGAPVVNAGDGQTINLPAIATLNGAATDDGLPVGSLLDVSWEKASGPGEVVFGDSHSAATTASFSESGIYVLRLTANDSLVSRSSDVIVTVNHAPIVDAGSEQLVTNLQAELNATVFDDGLPNGTLTNLWTKISGPGAVAFADNSSPTTTVTFSTSGVYVLQLTADDSLAQASAQVTITVDGAPTVSATTDSLVNFPATVNVSASASDDGLPVGSSLSYQWSLVNGPGTATFADETALQTTVSFSTAGSYVLQFTATDSLLSVSTNVTVIVNAAPSVSVAADNLAPRLPQTASLSATVTDDGLPSGTLSYAWTQVSGPGVVTFSNPILLNSTATFSQSGLYTLRLTADDGATTASADIVITALPENHPPTADAGTNQVVNFPDIMVLHGTVADDGVPIGSPNIAWSQLSGPGIVSFGDVHSATTSASASSGGVYVLRLTADDTLATNSADVTVKFNRAPTAQGQSVTAPEGQTTSITLIGNDPDGDTLQYTVVQTPHLGVLSGSGSNIVYTANVGTYGSDSFTFYVSDGLLTSPVATVTLQVVPFGRGRTYTLNGDFLEGNLTSLVATNDQLQTVVDLTHFNYVWVPVQNRGTIMRLDGETARPLGEYRLYPDGRANGFPSRIAIDSQGNCWVANERDNSILMIATPETAWVDKNHNGVLDTSQGQGDIRPWTNPGGVDSNGGTSTAEDELVVRYVRTSDTGIRFLAVNRDDNVWAGGTALQVFDLIDHATGKIIRTEPSIRRGGFGGFIDQNNVLWSAGTFLRWDTAQPLASVRNPWDQVGNGSFACAQDASGNIWVTYEYGRTVFKYGPDGAFIGQYPHGDRYGQGIAIDSSGDVWIAHSHCGSSVGHLKNDGTYVGSVHTAHGPTDVSIDRKGRVWVTTATAVLQRIDPLAGPIGADGVTPVGALDLTSPYLEGFLWAYGDFTGSGSVLSTERGLWSNVFDSGLSNAPWAGLSWDGLIGNDGDLLVSVATSDDGVTFSPLQPITIENSQPTNTGRYLKAVVNFVPATSGEGPTLQDINVGTVGWPVPPAIAQWQISSGGNMTAYWPDPVQLKGVIWHSAHKIAVNPTIQWSLVGGPGTVTFDDATRIQPTVRFSTNGTYHFRVIANNNGEIKSDDMTIALTQFNRAPFADAGPNLFVQDYATGTAVLQGEVRDDGLPLTNTLKTQWTQLYGPGTTTFGDFNSPITTATFSTNGIYVLQLSGDDGEFVSKALVTVRVGVICTIDNVPNLEAWWQANGTGDEHINGNQAFLENGAKFVQGKVGPAFDFDGVAARISVGANPHINLAKSSNPGFSIEFWINPNSFSNGVVMGWTNGIRLDRVNGGNIAGDTLRFVVAGITNGQYVNLVRLWSSTNVLNQWYHIAATWERSSTLAKIYLNGVLQDSAAVGTNLLSTSAEFYMGQVPGFLGTFKGQLDEVSLYSRTLDPEEIYNIYASGAAGKCPPEGNQAPTVDAGPNLFLKGVPATTVLNGQAFDDGLPTGSSLRVQWSKISGPGTVTFGSPDSAVTPVTFSTNGIYVLQLAADDSDVQSTSLVEVRVETLCSVDDAQGLVAWWPGNNTDTEVLNGYDAIQGNGESYTSGKVASAFNFNGVNNYVWIPAQSNYDVGTSAAGFTLEFWINPYTFKTGSVLGWANGVRIDRVNGAGTGDSLNFYIGGTSNNLYASAPFIWLAQNSTNQWYHIALTYDRTIGQAKTYTNGVLVSTATVGTNVMSTAGDFYLGQVPGSFAGLFNGALDEISIYNRPLNPEEVYNVFASGSAGKCPNDSNRAPTVYAGPDQFVRGVPGVATLQGQVSDDAQPTNSTVHVQWSKFSGPGAVTFADPTAPVTTATFSTNGIYVLELTVDDGEAQVSDFVEVRVETLCAVDNVQGLAAWWPANGLSDDVVNGYHGLLGSGTTYTNGKVASSFTFNGVNNYVWMLAQSNYDVATSAAGFSIEFWIDLYSFQTGSVLGWANGVRVDRVNGAGAGDSLNFYVGGTSNSLYASAPFIWLAQASTNQWYHIALTYDRTLGQAKIYTNGVLVSTATVGTNVMTTASDFYLGKVPGSISGYFKGALDEISIYNRPLNPEEVRNVFVSGSAGKCPEDANQPPIVFAGPNLVLSSTNNVAVLNGVVSDDGLPAGSTVRMQWSRFAGPGTVNFDNATTAVTTATFSTNGLYMLQLTADDSEASASSLTQVRVGLQCMVTDPSGLVAFWPGNGSADEFINGYDGYLGSGTTYTNGKVNAAFSFNGINNYVWMPAQTNYNVGASAAGFTLEFWMNPYAFQSGGVLGWANGVRVERINGLVAGDGLRFDVTGTGSGQPGAAFLWATPASTNQWYHIALTYDRTLGQAKIYTNGVLVATATAGTNILSTTGDFYLGQVPGTAGFLNGGLDEISIYNRPLVLSEVQAIFNAGSSGKCITPQNRAPFVTAGGNHTIYFPTNSITLPGAAYDDGLPSNTLNVGWTYLSGPSAVFFSNTNTASTTVTFTNTGVYTLQLSATDGQYTTNNTAVITVLPDPRTPPVVSISSVANGTTIEVPNVSSTTNISITANASDVDGTLTRIDVFADNTLITTLSTPPYSATISNLGVGIHTITAIATDNDGLSTTSAPVTVTVYVDTLPVATIFTPIDASSITAPTPIIGTASSPILQSYRLQYRSKVAEDIAPTAWSTLASGSTSVVSNTVAVFDPTLLLNGIYEIQLSATDIKGRTALSDVQTLLVSRNLKVGNFTLSFADLNVPLAGVPIQITRTYDSRDHRTNDFGVGWSLDISNVRLQKSRNLGANWFSTFESPWYSLDSIQPRRITITMAGDKTFEFESVLNPSEQFGAPIASTQMTFTNLPSTYGTLEIDGDNKADVAGSLGFINLIDLSTTDYFNPTRFKLTTAEGDVYIIDEKEGLKSLTDRNGNTLTITTNGIVHSSGVRVAFTRDDQGRITAITDPAGNKLNYTYATNGSLATFTDRETNTTTFAYTNAAFPNYLTEITDPRGVKAIRTEFDDSGRMVREIDGAGNVINFSHDLANNREIITDRLGNVTIHEYDDRGNVVRSTDALGNVTTHVYDDVDNELQKVDALGNTNTYTYDATGNKLTETDPLGYATVYTYGPYRVLTSIKNARGFTSTNAYDPGTGNLLQQTDSLGNVTSYSYDGAGNLLSRTDALGNVTSNRCDQLGHMTNSVVIDAVRGVLNSTTFAYDTNGNQISKSVQRTTSHGVETLLTQYVYDKNNRLVQTSYPDGSSNTTVYAIGLDKPALEIDPLGRQTLHFYDERGNATNTVFANGTSESTIYDAENRKIAMIDRAGRSIFYTNDPLGRLTSVLLPDGSVTNTYYDAIGRIIATQDERGNVTHYAYDPNCGCSGRQAYITNALGQVTHREYDENANESAMTDALGRTTAYIYDQLDRRTYTVYADATFTVTTYDALGRRIAETDQSTNTTRFGYDALSRLIAVTNALGKVTSYSYDELGSLISQTDANGHTTRFEYDSMGRRTKRTLPLGQIETYRYDLAGNLTNKVDFNGHTTIYAYDALNRLLSKTPDASFVAPPVVFTYTPTGQRATMTDAAGATTYSYDSRDFLTNKTWTPAGQNFSLALNYAYDPHGDISRIKSTSVNGVDLNYGYDPLNRLSTVADAHTGTTTYGYDDVGNLAGYTYPNGLASTYQYDSLNRLTNLSTINSQQSTVANYRYTVAPTGHRLTASENLATTNGLRTINRAYTYDATYRLINEAYNISGPVSLPPTANVHYTLDDVGNRLTRTSTLPGVENQTLNYDANDRLTTDTYDPNGNTVVGHIEQSAPAVSDAYDFEDHLIIRNNGQVIITYDGDGNRVTKTVSGTTTFYLVDDRNPTGYAQVLEEEDAIIARSIPNASRIYTVGNTLISQNQSVAVTNEPIWGVTFYGQDGHGNVRYLSDAANEITDIYDYDAFGTVITKTGSTPNSRLYCGDEFDADLRLTYNRSRYLDIDSGRFWTLDPYDGNREDPLSLHKYLYAYSNPVNLLDHSGQSPMDEYSFTQLVQKALMTGARINVRVVVQKSGCILMYAAAEEVVSQGVYIFLGETGTPYVGKTARKFATRMAEHLRTGALRNLNKVLGFIGVDGATRDVALKDIEQYVLDTVLKVSGRPGGLKGVQNLINPVRDSLKKVIKFCP